MRHYLFLITFCCISSILLGQVPQGIPYQAVARDAQGNPMATQSLTVQFSLHEASADGQIIYQETQTSSTNSQGLFSLTFGSGVPSIGSFGNINWGSGYKFLQVQANFGNGYVDLGTQQLMSVPYALYSGSSGNSSNGIADNVKLGKGFTTISQISSDMLTFGGAINYCANLEESGYLDWRLPTYEEVMNYYTINGYDNSSSSEISLRTLTTVQSGNFISGYTYSFHKEINYPNLAVSYLYYTDLAKCMCVR